MTKELIGLNGELCPHREFCGGCKFSEMAYSDQLAMKEHEVDEYIDKKKLKIGQKDPIEGAPTQYQYRNKMEYTFGDMVKDGETTLGMHKMGQYMSIITVDQCQLVHPDFNLILRKTLDFVGEKGYRHYHKRAHKGLMRNLIIRYGQRTGELLVNVVTTDEVEFDEAGFVDAILGLPLENKVVGVLRTINNDLADAVKCDELRTLYGQDFYMEEILGLKFKVSAFSFFQTNISAVEKLYEEAIDLIDDLDGKVVYDLFCGTGTISQAVARKAKEVIGVELVKEAVESAKKNAALNGLENCKFIAGDVFKVLDQVAEKPDVIIVDPPRMGIQSKALDKILNYGVEQIVYISCNPKTLIENLYYMEFNGYKVDYLKPFDNFPNTKHIETIVLLSRTDEKKLKY